MFDAFTDFVLTAILIAIIIPLLLALYTHIIASAWYRAREEFIRKLHQITRRRS